MLEGHIGLTKILHDQQKVGEAMFDSAVTALKARDDKNAKFYADQLVSVRALFESS